MNLDDLHSKWFKKVELVDCTIVNVEGQPTVKRKAKTHEAPLGDFMKDYIEHLAIPWYRRQWDWKLVEGEMRRILNQMSVQFVGGLF